MKKIMVIASILIMCVGLTGCGTKAASSGKVAVTESSETEQLLEQIQSDLSGTVWSGLEKDGSAYALQFVEDTLSLWIQDTNGETTEGSGYYKLSANNLYVFSDAECKNETMRYEYSIRTDELGQYIDLNNAVTLLRTQESDFVVTREKVSIASEYVSYFSQGTFWIGCDEDTAYIFTFASDGAYVGMLSIVDGEVFSNEIKGDWALDYDNFYLFSETGDTFIFNWYMEENGDELMLSLINDADNLELYESSAENMTETFETAALYLVNAQNPGTDLTTLLSGYRGVSIVDAFMRAGYSPSFANRKWCAEQFGLTGYRGSSKENLWLIEAMGGTTH